MEHKCIDYADQLLAAKSQLRDLTEQFTDKSSKFEQLTLIHEDLITKYDQTYEDLMNKTRLAQTLQLDHDNILFRLNE